MENTPKTVKSFLKKCLEIAHTNRDDLKEYRKLGDLRAGIQNDLGEMGDLLEKYGLKYNS